ncbi:MAG: CPBP family glutamic-type intramembrane protease [Hymenobacteraceae bacterium]|nr:CPBP family glutamic-type intramembrane protease [Hymenobacteraceae bacterium]
MKRLFQYLEAIPKSKRWVLLVVLLSIAAVPLSINLFYVSDELRRLMENQLFFVGIVLVVYVTWLALLYWLQKNDHVRLRHLSLTKAAITKGLLWGLILFLAVNTVLLLKAVFTADSLMLTKKFASLEGISKSLGVFTFNVCLNAFVEEVLCRAYIIPQFYLLLLEKIKTKGMALLLALLATQALFALLHLPRDLFRFDLELATIISTQAQLFMSGIILSLVYLRTRNVLFLTLFHAFMNYGLPIVGADADFKLYYMVSAFALTVFWSKLAGAGRAKDELAPELLVDKIG